MSAEDSAAIQLAFDQGGELSAMVELRRRFPGITGNENARRCVQAIAGWKPPAEPVVSDKVTRLRPRSKARPAT